ncbi:MULTISPECIES: MerR family transcriptional regulator [Shouchella]|jgi:DNA-binding transcriptional MerR regulator|uniref:MerR family transcriptional regulator n=1 Tax=Shouchella TaxID=2893057 RepID=UPI00090FEA4C|nr:MULTISPECIES: MerR family transcriptional regulator [Shouchella]MBX0321341.1 MerR family transcriptional regulator [Shouchella clausii]MDO7282632.1 MerR family transcriptional regulator [Shouchella clausii]MDO7302729.1 MerR family transcriptional regulator [Shouchella clausii]PAD18639.1 MerR family transcriptional regulator [Shouchella clausii]PAD90890.1 MerR family transcriptional regulator [Shouchella clausii]
MDGWSIQEVSKKTGLSVHTLRYYERIGLMDYIARTDSGRRTYSEHDLEWLTLLTNLRSTGMAIKDMQHFAEMVRNGEATIPDRRKLLEAHQQKLEKQLEGIERTLAIMEKKISVYRSWEESLGTT